MPATTLPSSGEHADPIAAKTCDASGMAEIHRFFRAGFAEGPDLVHGVKHGDTSHAEVVADQLEMLSIGLHAHHEGEEMKLWDTLDARAPSCAVHVARMKEQHADMLVHLTDLDSALVGWRTSASTADSAPILTALDGINGALEVHLGDEETNIVPVMETTLTVDEAEWFAKHGRKATPKGQTWNQLGAILAAQPDGGDEWLHKHMPPPARLIWRVIGKRRYRAHREALAGR